MLESIFGGEISYLTLGLILLVAVMGWYIATSLKPDLRTEQTGSLIEKLEKYGLGFLEGALKQIKNKNPEGALDELMEVKEKFSDTEKAEAIADGVVEKHLPTMLNNPSKRARIATLIGESATKRKADAEVENVTNATIRNTFDSLSGSSGGPVA